MEKCQGGTRSNTIEQEVPDELMDGWEDNLILATFYTAQYRYKAAMLKSSAEKYLPGVRFMSFIYDAPNRREAILNRPLQMYKCTQQVAPYQSVLWVDADDVFVRRPTEVELAQLIGFRGCDRFAVTKHPNILNRQSPCLGLVMFRGELAHRFIERWAERVERNWKEYAPALNIYGNKNLNTCNGTFGEEYNKRIWQKNGLFDFSLSDIWNRKDGVENPVMVQQKNA